VQRAISQASAIIAAYGAAYEVLYRYGIEKVRLINETTAYTLDYSRARSSSSRFELCGVGKDLENKALFPAIDVR
jgi:hypothetical protein